MRRVLLLAAALVAAVVTLGAGPRGWAAPAAAVGKLTWFGQSCFLLETAGGTKILMDPFGKALGYPMPAGLRVDLITISHEHPDHDNVKMASNSPKVIHGVTADRKGWVRVDEKFRDVAIRTVGVYHDDKRGALRGLNTVFIFEVGGLRIAHLGDLGHLLDDEELEAIGSVDVLLVPVGGTTTLDAYHATRVVDQLHPRLMVVPMHDRTDVPGTKDLDPVDPFLERKANVHRPNSPTVAITPVKARPATEILVLPYR